MLFKRGKAISGAPTKIGTNQLPKPPIKIGITIKKIIINACKVMKTFHKDTLSIINCKSGRDNSKRIYTDNAVPITPENAPNIKYSVPISL